MKKTENNYIELLEGFLMNHFRPFDSYEEGVESALQEFNSDATYKSEMEDVFDFIFRVNFEENFCRDIVRKSANFFVSDDEAAQRRLQFIYEDVIINDKDSVDEFLMDDDEEEEKIIFDPKTMSVESLTEEIFDDSLSNENRINAALALRKSGDDRVWEILQKAINAKDDNLRNGFALVLIGGEDWGGKVALLQRLLKEDPSSSVRRSAAYVLGELCNPEVIRSCVDALGVEQSGFVQAGICRALAKYGVEALRSLVNALEKDKDYLPFLKQVLTYTPKNSETANALISLFNHPSVEVQIVAVQSSSQFLFKIVKTALEKIITGDSDPKVKHFTQVSLSLLKGKDVV